jgi:hypothetical protein
MFFQKKPPTKFHHAVFRALLDAAVDDAIAARIDLRILADQLEDKAQSLRFRYACTAPLY